MDKPLCGWCKENDFSEGCEDCYLKPSQLPIIIYRTSPDKITVSVEEGGSAFTLEKQYDKDLGTYWAMTLAGGVKDTLFPGADKMKIIPPIFCQDLEHGYGYGMKLLHEHYFKEMLETTF
jgi:hypothetical protein